MCYVHGTFSRKNTLSLRESVMCFIPCLPLKSRSVAREILEDGGAAPHVKLYSYRELRQATGNFKESNKIGEGGFGSVYKAKLKDGRVAAVKVLSTESRQGMKEFLTEIKVVSEIHHENLVELYGCCVEGDNRILVYNYLENNCLAQTLLRGHNNIHFNWKTRINICIGIARGLAYLHNEIRPHILHRDIKASNILLDRDLNPKISDFGLAKLLPPNATHVSTRIAGTLGYLAPEYAMRGQATEKSDVYSFGVLLLEIISGRHNKNSNLPPEDRFLLERTWKLYERDELELIVDTELNGEYNPEEACRFLKVSLLCTQDALKLRPSMTTIVKILTGEKRIRREITRPGLLVDFMPQNRTEDPYSPHTGSSSAYNTSSKDTTNTSYPLATVTNR